MTRHPQLSFLTKDQHHSFDDWAVIAALQALTIYILLAIFEEDELSPNIDARLLHAMAVSTPLPWRKALTLGQAIAKKAEESNNIACISQYTEWQEWVIGESKHR